MASLKKDFITAFGIEDNIALQICEKHREVLDEIIKERDGFKEDAEKLADVQKQLNKANEKIKELEADNNPDETQKKLEKALEDKKTAEKALADYKAEVDSKEKLTKKTEAYKNLLKEVGVSEKRLDSILKVTDIDSIETEDDGKFKNADELKKSIETEWADFIVTEGVKGADFNNPPANNGGRSKPASRASQLAKSYYADLYGSVKED